MLTSKRKLEVTDMKETPFDKFVKYVLTDMKKSNEIIIMDVVFNKKFTNNHKNARFLERLFSIDFFIEHHLGSDFAPRFCATLKEKIALKNALNTSALDVSYSISPLHFSFENGVLFASPKQLKFYVFEKLEVYPLNVMHIEQLQENIYSSTFFTMHCQLTRMGAMKNA